MSRLYSRRRARSSLFHTAYFRTLSQLTTVAGYIVLVRGMSEHDFGVFNLLYALIPVLSTAASLGLEHVLRRYQPEYLSRNEHATAAWLTRFIGRMRFGSNLVILTVIFFSWHVVTPLFQLDPYRPEYVLFSAVILLYFQVRVLELSLASHMLHQYAVGMTVLLAAAKLVGYLVLTALEDLSLRNAILVDTIAHGIAYIGLYIAYRRLCSLPEGTVPQAPARGERRRLLRYGLFYNFNDAGTLTLNARADTFFVAAVMDPIAVGTYAFYTRLSLMASKLLPVRMFESVVQPLFFATPQEQASERVPNYFTLLVNTSLLVTLPMTGYAAVYHREIVEVVFAGRFIEHSALLPLVLLFFSVKAVSTPVTLVAQYSEKALIILLSKVFGIYNVVMLLALIPIFGVYGAALATGSSGVLKNLFIWWHVRDKARWKNWRAAIASSAVCWGAFYLAGTALKEHLLVAPWVHLVIGAVLCLATAAVFVRSTALSQADRETLASVLAGREARLLKLIGLTR